MTVFLPKFAEVVCHCLPQILPVVRFASLSGEGTNSSQQVKVGMEVFGSEAQAGSEPPSKDVG